MASASELRVVDRTRSDMVLIPGGTFRMGSDNHYPEEAPAHRVTVSDFWIDRTPVTNREFRRFVEATGHVTFAEIPPDPKDYPGALPHMLYAGSLVFRSPGHAVALDDWTQWAGKDLPTEAQWEFAARGGLDGAEFAWGEEFTPGGKHMANTWQGNFPHANDLLDGYELTSPVTAFPPNGYGLLDMIGNVWEWTTDWYSSKHEADAKKPCCIPQNPRGGTEDASYDLCDPNIRIPRKVLKGGSHLCAPSYCRRYRPAARHGEPIDTSTSHVGFRCVANRIDG